MKLFFRSAALFDWITGLGLIFALDPQVKMLRLEPPNYPGIFILVGGVTLIFGWIFWAVASFLGLLPVVFFPISIITDGIWIPPFIYFYKRLQPLGAAL